ncbi:MAG: NAD(P)/FAD-dependent oxidoreductase, partial [Chitinophagales bacterium]
LMAARELLKKGKSVTILEARNRIGGRIHTMQDDGFNIPAEAGAEFIHGRLPVTLKLVKEAGLKHYTLEGKMIRDQGDKLSKDSGLTKGWPLVTKRLKQLTQDMSIADFLQKYFNDEQHVGIKKSVKHFAEGYNAADISVASAIALREEWLGNDAGGQYRIRGGYRGVTDFLMKEITHHGADVQLSAVVKKIQWKPGSVTVLTEEGLKFFAPKVIITISLGVLKQDESERGAITFSPAIPSYRQALTDLGYGHVIKILLQFHELFWTRTALKKRTGVNMKNMGFLFTEEIIPTWWTQLPEKIPLLTGWIGGPEAKKLSAFSEEIILQKSLKTLAAVFKMSIFEIKEQLSHSHIANWSADEYSRGAYSFETLKRTAAAKILNTPIESTIYFSGEGLYNGSAGGTVEAALVSGNLVTDKI